MQAKLIAALVLTNNRLKLWEEHKTIQTFNLQLPEISKHAGNVKLLYINLMNQEFFCPLILVLFLGIVLILLVLVFTVTGLTFS